jgi:hypothetical protein
MKDTHEPAAEPLGMNSLITRAEKASSLDAQQRRTERGDELTGPSLEKQP